MSKLFFLPANQLTPPHPVTNMDHYEALKEAFEWAGWDPKQPPLVGYPFEKEIQLVTGSHRWAAALATNTLVPIIIHSFRFVYEVWGTEAWKEVLKPKPVNHYLYTYVCWPTMLKSKSMTKDGLDCENMPF